MGTGQDLHCEDGGVLGSVDGHGGHRDAGRHLDEAQQGIHPVQGSSIDGNADHRQGGVGGNDPAQVGNLDRRLEVGKKDAVFFHVLGVVATVIATIWMYAFGTGDPAEMRYFLGMPMWVSGAIVIYLAMFVVGMIWLVKWEEFPLTARFKKDSMNKKEGGEQA